MPATEFALEVRSKALLRRAKSVSLVIHGVGSINAPEVAAAAMKGFRRASISSKWQARRVRVEGIPNLDAAEEPCEAIVIEAPDELHVLLLLTWSGLRIRIAPIILSASGLLALIAAIGLALGTLLSFPVAYRLMRSVGGMIVLAAVIGSYLMLTRTRRREARLPGSDASILNVVRGIQLGPPFAIAVMLFLFRHLPALAGGLLLLLFAYMVALMARAAMTAGPRRWRVLLWLAVIAMSVDALAVTSNVVTRLQRISVASYPQGDHVASASGTPLASHTLEYDSGGDRSSGGPVATRNAFWGSVYRVGSSLFDIPVGDSKVLGTSSIVIGPATARAIGFGFVVCCTMLLCAAMAFWIVDLVLDIAWYVGSPGMRRHLQAQTATIINAVQAETEGTVVLVGHSLGSVIASSALAEEHPSVRTRNLVLVTMGSPLAYLWRVFPSAVRSPVALCESYLRHGGIATWLNLWRSHDPIGQGMDAYHDSLVQRCIGAGGHRDYWKDGETWRVIGEHIRGTHDGAGANLPNVSGAQWEQRAFLAVATTTGLSLIVCNALGDGLTSALMDAPSLLSGVWQGLPSGIDLISWTPSSHLFRDGRGR